MENPIIAKLGQLEEVDGSAKYEYNDTQAITSVTGPIETFRIRNEHPTKAFIDINIRPASGTPATRENLLEQKLLQVLTPMINLAAYPRQTIQIVCQLLRTGESAIFTAKELVISINSTYLALLDAGVQLNSSFLATSCCITSQGQIISDPSEKDLNNSQSHHVVVFTLKDSQPDELIFVDSMGEFTKEELLEVLKESAISISQKNVYIRQLVNDSVNNDYKWKTT